MKHILFLLLGLAILACNPQSDTTSTAASDSKKLPILGERDIVDGDTVFHKVPDFTFMNQDSALISNQTFTDDAYVVDFFFTSCPTICPKVKKQMLRIYDHFEQTPDLKLLSHSIDTRHDSVSVLKDFAEKLEVSSDRWHFVTGDEFKIYDIADDYFIAAQKDKTAPGGFDHSGRIILVDKNRHVRAFADGTDPESVDKFIKEIELLLNES